LRCSLTIGSGLIEAPMAAGCLAHECLSGLGIGVSPIAAVTEPKCAASWRTEVAEAENGSVPTGHDCAGGDAPTPADDTEKQSIIPADWRKIHSACRGGVGTKKSFPDIT
jgi:hypothetical protein